MPHAVFRGLRADEANAAALHDLEHDLLAADRGPIWAGDQHAHFDGSAGVRVVRRIKGDHGALLTLGERAPGERQGQQWAGEKTN